MNMTKSFLGLAMLTLLSGCLVKASTDDNGLKKFTYSGLSLEDDSDGTQNLTGTGTALYKTSLSDASALIRMHISAKFPSNSSSITIHSHSNSDLSDAYDLKFTRVGSTLRLTTTINALDSESIGVVFSGVTTWTETVDFVVQVDNSGAKPVAKVWAVQGTFNEASTPTLTETRNSGFPEGERVGLTFSNASLYSFSFEDLTL